MINYYKKYLKYKTKYIKAGSILAQIALLKKFQGNKTEADVIKTAKSLSKSVHFKHQKEKILQEKIDILKDFDTLFDFIYENQKYDYGYIPAYKSTEGSAPCRFPDCELEFKTIEERKIYENTKHKNYKVTPYGVILMVWLTKNKIYKKIMESQYKKNFVDIFEIFINKWKKTILENKEYELLLNIHKKLAELINNVYDDLYENHKK
jgi:hypothetical protein